MSTICAIATAPGGAIGIIRVSGSDSNKFVNNIFSRDISNALGYSLHYGHIVDPLQKEIIDEVIISIFRSPQSYTGEDSVEISCHGSSYILQKIIYLLLDQGCKLAEPGEFTKRAFLNGKMDLSQAEAIADLIASQNSSQHKIAMQHLRGGITTRLNFLHDKLLEITSLLELELDFSDHEEIEFANRSEISSIAFEIEKEISRLITSFAQGNAIKSGIPVAIIGAPNVGKSTLLNKLLKDERAIVSPIQGTTRDTIEDTITIDGILFRFIDTAGIRNTSNPIEQMGINQSYKAIEKAKIIILMTEPDTPFIEIPANNNQIVIKVTNKADKKQITDNTSLKISALTGLGIDNLVQVLLSSIEGHNKQDEVLISNLRHKEALELAHNDILRAMDAMSQDISTDLIAEDLKLCISHLGEILGKQISNKEILQNIFSTFCIGK